MPGFQINGSGTGPNANVETARSYRWLFKFDSILLPLGGSGAMGDVAMYALSTQRPSVEIDVINIHNKQTQLRLPGKHRWNPINVKFYEVFDGLPSGTTSSNIFKYWSSGANAVVNFADNTINQSFRTTCSIAMLDGGTNERVMYQLFNVWPGKVEPSELIYSNSEIATTQVTLHYDSSETF